ncbi:hypothetical protein A2W24_03545 [Microgenomates group bacterium RBG_16_45_19]|nr:MAG: hypothetical protein A2W24_03545 [Microgenomates group bacterium RBG_16_45_19]
MLGRFALGYSLFLVSGFLILASPALAQTHPFLLVRPEQLPTLQSRASQAPWSSMKQDALDTCLNLNYLDTQNQPPLDRAKGYRVREIASACALAYILNPPNQTSYRQKLINTFNLAWPDIRAAQQNEPISYEYQPPVAAGFFHALLALDILHDDLDPATLAQQEAYLYDQFVYFSSRPTYLRYPPMGAAVATLWLTYKRDAAIPPHPSCNPSLDCCNDRVCWKNLYLNGRTQPSAIDGLLDRLSDSGVYREGSLYAHTAYSHIRDERTFLIDVLEFTHEDNSLYPNPRLQHLYEWLYGYASAPNGFMIPFSDTSDFQRIYDPAENIANFIESAATLRAFKFSTEAGQYALWRLGQSQLPGNLLTYLFTPYPYPTTIKKPDSRLYSDGGAFFVEPNAVPASLYGAMWNISTNSNNDFHKHKDTNALYLSGYNEQLLVNVGFCGAPNLCSNYSDENLYSRAVLNNTALINYTIGNPTAPNLQNDHNPEKVGGGLIEGITNPQTGFDYALGDSGPALPNGNHQRSFIFIHPKTSIPGYYVVFDQITPNDGSTRVHLAWHPHTDNLVTQLANTQYLAHPGPASHPNVLANPTAGLSIFLGTHPTSVDLVPGLLAHWQNFNQFRAYLGQYLFTTYQTASNQPKNIATILSPFDSEHPVPPLTPINAPNTSGAMIQSSSSTYDTALVADQPNLDTFYQGVSFMGFASWYRTDTGTVTAYFVQKGTNFNDHQLTRHGFQANSPVTLHLNQTQGNIISPGTQVTFYYPGLMGIRLGGQLLASTPVTNGRQATIPAGTHTLELVTDGSPTPTSSPPPDTDLDNNGVTDWRDLLVLLTHFAASGPNLPADLNHSLRVDIFDFNLLIPFL